MMQSTSSPAQAQAHTAASLKLVLAAISVTAAFSGWAALSVARPVPKSNWINDPLVVRANATAKQFAPQLAPQPIAITRSSQ